MLFSKKQFALYLSILFVSRWFIDVKTVFIEFGTHSNSRIIKKDSNRKTKGSKGGLDLDKTLQTVVKYVVNRINSCPWGWGNNTNP